MRIAIIPLLPFVILAGTAVVSMLVVAFYRNHRLTFSLACGGLLLALCTLPFAATRLPCQVTPLLLVDDYALFFAGLIICAALVIAFFSYDYLEGREGDRDEYYMLLVIATLGAVILVASDHFASFILGLEMMSVSFYALIAYIRRPLMIEAGVKYLILAGASASFMLFGMAMIYAQFGTMSLSGMTAVGPWSGSSGLLPLVGMVMILVGIGFKLGLVPFHLWTPDVYQGAPAPVTAYIATVSKGAVFALLLRYFSGFHVHAGSVLGTIFMVIAIASMFAGNLLALQQNNIKRLLAYSSIAHLGYLLVAFLASGPLKPVAVMFYLVAYFITTLGAFGVVTMLSDKGRDADELEDYQGLAWRHPALSGALTVMLLSLAGIPLTAGFIGKFYLVAAGVGSGLWLLIVVLLINSTIGLFYYVRVLVAMYGRRLCSGAIHARKMLTGSVVLTILVIVLVWLGVYPSPLLELIRKIGTVG